MVSASDSAATETAHDQTEHAKTGAGTGTGSSKEDQSVYTTVSERPIGTYARAFSFPVDVDHEHDSSYLDAGLLRIKVPKLVNPVTEDSKKGA